MDRDVEHMRSGPVTDVHTHLMPARYLDYLRSRAGHPAAAAALPWLETGIPDAPALVRGMDDAGVDVSWVSYPPPGVVDEDEDEASRWASELNDALQAVTAPYSDRLRPLPLLPVPHPRASMDVVAEYGAGCTAMVAYLPAAGRQMDGPEFRPVLRAVADLGVPLLVHPGVEPIGPLLAGRRLGSAMSAPVATAAAAARLILGGVLDDVPHLQVILSHLGGVLPFLLPRLEEQAVSDAACDIRYYLRRNLLFDSAVYDDDVLRCAAAVLGADRIVLGSDVPFRGEHGRAVDAVRSALGAAGARTVLSGAPAPDRSGHRAHEAAVGERA